MPNKSKGPGVNSEGLFSGIAKSIVGGVTGVGAGVAKGIGSIAAAMGVPPAMVAGVSAVLLTASVAGGMGAMSADDLARITSKPDCRETYQAAQVAGASTLNDIDMDAQKRENARIIYSVLKTYNPNLSDAHIAAALSNWDAEGGIDPTSIEGIYDEHYQVGPRKQAAMSDDLASHTVQLMDSYTISINRNAYFASEPGHYMCGMGMAQHTGNGAWAFLSAARGLGVEWSDMTFNIAYNIYTGSPCGGTPPGCPDSSEFWDYFQNVTGSPEEICHWFTQYYEGNTSFINNHDDSLDRWLSECSTFQVDTSAANSALSMLSTMGKTAVAASVSEAASSCVRCTPKTAYGNSTIAEAAAAISWPTREESKNNNGTEVYKTVHDVVLPGEGLYMSCDRGACTAVRWSGADKDYPVGPCASQMAYMLNGEGKEKWQHVGTADTLKMEDLQPGDVFVCPSHTFIYVGEDAIKAVHGERATAGANSVSASLNERSPAASTEATQVIGQDHDYHVFRNIKPDPDETYVHAYDAGSIRKSGSAASTSGSRGSCEEEDETTGAFGNEEAPAGSDAARLVDAAKRVPSPGGGLCAMWVTQVFNAAGLSAPGGNANDMYAAHCHSNDRGQLKPGMIIAIDAHSMTEAGSIYGHVGIYIGGGMVMDNIGEIRTYPIDKWCDDYNTYNIGGGVKWGWVNGQALC